MDDLPSGFLRQRRNLISISVAFIVFVAADGKFDKISFPVIGITLENEVVALWGAWAVLLYFLWRYWLYSEPIRKEFKNNCHDVLANNPKFRALAKQRLVEEHGIDHQSPYPIVERSLFRRTFDYTIFVLGRNTQHNSDLKGKKANIAFIKLLPLETLSFITATLKYRGFSDYVLPYLLAGVAMVLGGLELYCGAQS